MKRILFFVLALMLCTMPVFATGEAEAVETVSKVTSIASVAGIGVLLVAIITFVFSKMKWIKNTLHSIINAFTVIFGKGGKVENVPQAIAEIETAFNDTKIEFEKILAEENKKFENLKCEYEKQHKENNEFKQAFALMCIYANNINPYVKNEIYRLIKGEIPFKETIEETANEIESFADAVRQSEPKLETPHLDAVAKE